MPETPDPAGWPAAPDLVAQDGIGIPDHLARLWTPHRMAYVTGGSDPNRTGGSDSKNTKSENTDKTASATELTCPFCRIPTLSDEAGLIVARGERVYAVLNLFPYNPGHLMVVPCGTSRTTRIWTPTS